ncbi:MAG TPA: hypothetical protein VNU19_22500, partial [Candidatus Acidoferrum sp.]|nr:hypothetical protein [Candidatus Acidoferrum sp.]
APVGVLERHRRLDRRILAQAVREALHLLISSTTTEGLETRFSSGCLTPSDGRTGREASGVAPSRLSSSKN